MPRKNYKPRSKGNSNNSARKARQFDKDEYVKEKANDPSWYTVAGQITKDVASLSFNNPAGIEYHLNTTQNGSFVSPGICDIFVAPVPGYSDGLSSPINVAAKNFYSWIRQANSGAKNYDSPDMMLYLMAMDSAYAFYAWMLRLYGVIRIYSQTNRYLGANLARACRVDADSIATHLADFRAYINMYAMKLSVFAVPATMSLFKRHMWMFSNVFKDENTSKAQFYMYQPAYFYRYDEYNGAGRCVPEPLTVSATAGWVADKNYNDLVTYGDNLLASIVGSEDINIMSGDILKAFGDNIWKLEYISDDFGIIPMFSEEVLSQIHNTVFAGSMPADDTTYATQGFGTFAITQDPNIGNGCLICKPAMKQYGGNIGSAHILDFWKEEVTPDDIIVATRNMVGGSTWSDGHTQIWTCGTEIPLYAAIYNLKTDGTMMYQTMFDIDDLAYYTNYTWGTTIARLSKINYFNEHPYIYMCDYGSSAPYAAINAGESIGEMSNFTILENIDLEKMHLSAVLSEFAVPFLGNAIRK